MKIIKKCLIVASAMCFAACSSSKSTMDDQRQSGGSQTTNVIQPVGEPIAPGSCNVVATVLRIDAERRSTDANSPCSKAPCWATVKIDSILGYGPAFENPLAVGQEISVMFGFTLSPTKDLFPSMTESYPGLRVGSRFFANVRAGSEMGSVQTYTIYGYKIR